MATTLYELTEFDTDDRTRPAVQGSDRGRSAQSRSRRRIDVSELDARGVQEYVRANVETDAVSLEHRGSRTFLLVGE